MASFISTDFSFNNISSSTYNLQIVKVEGSGLIPTPVSGGKSIHEEYSPFHNSPFFYKAQMQPMNLSLQFTISATPNSFDETTRMAIFDWLYSPMVYCDFVSQDNPNKVYKIIFNSPLEFNTVDFLNGFFELSAQCYPTPFTTLTTYEYNISATPTTITINNLQNVRNYDNTYYYYPIIFADLTSTANSLKITNTSDTNRVFEITSCELLEQLYIDNALKIINSSVSGVNRFATLTNKQWLRLVKGVNVLTVNTTADISIQCQYPILS
jgi:hypothetical protein